MCLLLCFYPLPRADLIDFNKFKMLMHICNCAFYSKMSARAELNSKIFKKNYEILKLEEVWL